MLQGYTEKQFFLIGNPLSHSFSPEIHAAFADYRYSLKEIENEDLPSFFKTRDFDGMNVTIPHKTAVIPFLDELSPEARAIGAVNTVVKKNGRLYGDNTDYYGFSYMIKEAPVDVSGKKCLVLGSGGASKTVTAVLCDLGAASVTVISRTGEDNYENLERHSDAEILVNATPVGMYPKNGESPIELSLFPSLSAVFDLIYNPKKTRLLFDAACRGIYAANGLSMLVAQAKRATELFTGQAIPDSEIPAVVKRIERTRDNIILIGMPGCGKTTVGRILAEKLSRKMYDTDAIVMARTGKNIPAIFRSEGEAAFRRYEAIAASVAGRETGCVIATGGGIVTREENRYPLSQNGTVVFLRRDIRNLATSGRPLSDPETLAQMYEKRLPLYLGFADLTLDMKETAEETANAILEVLYP